MTTVDSRPADQSPAPVPAWRSVGDRIRRGETVRIFGALVILCAVFSILSPHAFPTSANIVNIASDASVLLVLAVGATYVILTAGIDLSVSGVLVFAGVVSAKVMVALGGQSVGVLLLGLVAGLVAGLVWGLINGVLVAKARIPALIVTLGTLGASQGVALLLTNGVDVRDVPFNLVLSVGSGKVAGVPWLVVIALAVAIVGGVVLSQTRFGRYTYAAGSNAEALRRTGVASARHLIKVYAVAGTLAGLAGYLSLARFATTTLGGHATDNLSTIAAVVIGGTSLFGGRGTMIGTVIGVFIPTVLQNGFVVLGVQAFWQQVAVGVVLIAAVYLDQMRRAARERP
ncbi:MAG: monosaccharide-transporting ATPase [Actinoallomurus sp.]|jgi:ribose transport system permease protein|nr:monosaccharide-transporting ATPase [Actinoallomurus sp.]